LSIRPGLIGAADEVVDAGIEAIRRRLDSSASCDDAYARQRQIDAAAHRLLDFGKKYRFSQDGAKIKKLVNQDVFREGKKRLKKTAARALHSLSTPV
jgi:hypothetical protein